ncbi:DNA binding protein [Streptomyces phage Yaboi]|uniref:DNA binding protein n=1 Tax=Streptomyces phage Yaboi TaxID=2301621 RepID=A0A385UIQ2_9CAUD|nr:hypothetical protein HWB86_gp159 [Streptomyces phage Yaboi]AYB70960.1 DNA binding protein [Streptomyces phage Yaboi]WNM73711.1 DNA binding protein [Streptomyces phage Sollertia]
MKNCPICDKDKKLDEFGRQITNPSKFYKWCRDCRLSMARRKRNDFNEGRELRSKTVQLRKLTDAQVVEVKLLAEWNTPYSEIAQQYGVSATTISKVVNKGYANVY